MPASKFKTLIQRILSRPSKPRKKCTVIIDKYRRRCRIELEMLPCMELKDIEYRLKNRELSVHGKVTVYPDSASASLSNGILTITTTTITTVPVLPDPGAKKEKKPGASGNLTVQDNLFVILPDELDPNSIKCSLSNGKYILEGSFVAPDGE